MPFISQVLHEKLIQGVIKIYIIQLLPFSWRNTIFDFQIIHLKGTWGSDSFKNDVTVFTFIQQTKHTITYGYYVITLHSWYSKKNTNKNDVLGVLLLCYFSRYRKTAAGVSIEFTRLLTKS
jgi:hypothetical protein